MADGSIDVYERDGRYQLYAKKITLDGTGDLFLRFQKLRDELEEMGMFAREYKQPIPRYAMTVGIVTASTGAAIRDIINIARRRNPYVQLVLCPAQVQGEQAKYSIVRGIETLDALGTGRDDRRPGEAVPLRICGRLMKKWWREPFSTAGRR